MGEVLSLHISDLFPAKTEGNVVVMLVNSENYGRHSAELAHMYRERKRVFVDMLKWDIPCDGPFERDQFDDEFAEYLLVSDPETGDHLGSMRLLRTDRPHILGSLFPELCGDQVPTGPTIREVTRLCLSPRLRARDRLQVRNRLFTALVEYGLLSGITGYSGVAEVGWLSQLLALGWRCTPLGLPRTIDGSMLGAVLAHVEPGTIQLFRDAGTYETSGLRYIERERAAA
jgi:N-acyl-L-homoserine lactone synthetase